MALACASSMGGCSFAYIVEKPELQELPPGFPELAFDGSSVTDNYLRLIMQGADGRLSSSPGAPLVLALDRTTWADTWVEDEPNAFLATMTLFLPFLSAIPYDGTGGHTVRYTVRDRFGRHISGGVATGRIKGYYHGWYIGYLYAEDKLERLIRETDSQTAVVSVLNDIYQRAGPMIAAANKAERGPDVTWRRGRPRVYDIAGIRRIAVLPFNNDEFTDCFRAVLVNNSKWSVYTRSDLGKVLDEHDLQLTAAFDKRTAVKVGKLTGVQMVVYGSYTPTRVVVKSVDVQTGEYLVYESTELSGNASIPWHARVAATALLPHTFELRDGRPASVWVGQTADKHGL